MGKQKQKNAACCAEWSMLEMMLICLSWFLIYVLYFELLNFQRLKNSLLPLTLHKGKTKYQAICLHSWFCSQCDIVFEHSDFIKVKVDKDHFA